MKAGDVMELEDELVVGNVVKGVLWRKQVLRCGWGGRHEVGTGYGGTREYGRRSCGRGNVMWWR